MTVAGRAGKKGTIEWHATKPSGSRHRWHEWHGPDELALIVADELTHNGQRMTRQEWWEGPVGQHLAAVPDQRWTIEDVVIAEHRMAVRYQDSGTPTGKWIGLEPTGARISFREYVFYTVSGDRITEVWSVFDSETIRRQLSAEPPSV